MRTGGEAVDIVFAGQERVREFDEGGIARAFVPHLETDDGIRV